MDASEYAFKLREEFGDWYIREDALEKQKEEAFREFYGEHGDFQLVGHGRQTNSYCGKFHTYKGCIRVDLHNIMTLDGVNYAGKVFIRKVRYSCGKPSCPVCYKHGWANRQARRIEARLEKASKRFGQVEHIICSVPIKSYSLPMKSLRIQALKALKIRGCFGGVLIFHAFRYNPSKLWYWAPHFHVLGYLFGDKKYSRCRGCHKRNTLFCTAPPYNCTGFEAWTRKCNEKDGYIVKIALDKHGQPSKRDSIHGSAWYQLHHSSIKKDSVRFHVATWFGTCSYRNLKVTAEMRKDVCPLCKHELVDLEYFGAKHFNLEFGSLDFERDSYEDYEEDGRVVWRERVKRGWSGDSKIKDSDWFHFYD